MTFETFWESYPRKVGRIAAQKSYEKAVKKHGAATILSGLSRFKFNLPEKQFIPHPATWLNQGRFLDPVDRTTGNSGFREDITRRWVGGRAYSYTDALGFRQNLRSGYDVSADEREAMRLWGL